MAYITVEAVRHALLDRSAADNMLENALAFGDDEIKAAMQRTVSTYNGTHPLVHNLHSAECIPDMGFFMDGVIYHLYLAYWGRAARNRVQYQAGNMVADPEALFLEYLKQVLPALRDSFLPGIKTHKITHNISLAYGTYV